MFPIVLFRSDRETEAELAIARKHLVVAESRLDIIRQELVVGRYSVLPFYQELERDVVHRGAKLINSYREHRYVADAMAWTEDLLGLTPETWSSPEEAMKHGGPYFLKGATNSKKFQWDTHAFAADNKGMMEVYGRLQDDALIGAQDIIIRRFVPLRRLATGPRGLPISEEYRFFVLDGQVLASGFYWSSYATEVPADITPANVPKSFLDEAIWRVAPNIPFFVMDVARTEAGDWIVVELNDGQMSGLSECDPDKLYRRMREVLDARFKSTT